MFTTAVKLADSVFFFFFFYPGQTSEAQPSPTHTKDVASRNEVRTVEVKHDKMPLSKIKGKLQAVVFVCTLQKKPSKISKKEKE